MRSIDLLRENAMNHERASYRLFKEHWQASATPEQRFASATRLPVPPCRCLGSEANASAVF